MILLMVILGTHGNGCSKKTAFFDVIIGLFNRSRFYHSLKEKCVGTDGVGINTPTTKPPYSCNWERMGMDGNTWERMTVKAALNPCSISNVLEATYD